MEVTHIETNGSIDIMEVVDGDVTEFYVYGVTQSGDPIVRGSLEDARKVYENWGM